MVNFVKRLYENVECLSFVIIVIQHWHTQFIHVDMEVMMWQVYSITIIYFTFTAVYISTLAVHDVVHDVVTDWSYALAGFLVSTLFGVSPDQS